MSSSRRDFFSTLASAVLAWLGWRPRPASAAPGSQPPAPAASDTHLSTCDPTVSYSVSYYDADGRLVGIRDICASMWPEAPEEQ